MTKRIRVVRTVARLGISGVTQHVILLTAAIQETYPTLVVTGTPDPREGDMSDRARENGLELFNIPELGRSVRPFDDLVAFWKLWRLYRSVRPDIVHTHTAKAGALGRLAAWLAGVPIRIHTFHGHVLRGYFGPVKNAVFRVLERLLAHVTTQIIAISPLQEADLRGILGLGPEKIRTIPLGLSLEHFASADPSESRRRFRSRWEFGDELVLSIVGRLVPIKNHELALRAFAILLQTRPDARFVIVGDGEEEARLRRLVQELELEQHVVFAGWSHDLEGVYYGSDVVVLSSDNEGTPVSVIEALACGCAVVSTNVGGVRDVLMNGELGLIVPPGDVDALASGLSCLSNPVNREKFAGKAQSLVLAKFGISRLARDITALYGELLANNLGR